MYLSIQEFSNCLEKLNKAHGHFDKERLYTENILLQPTHAFFLTMYNRSDGREYV